VQQQLQRLRLWLLLAATAALCLRLLLGLRRLLWHCLLVQQVCVGAQSPCYDGHSKGNVMQEPARHMPFVTNTIINLALHFSAGTKLNHMMVSIGRPVRPNMWRASVVGVLGRPA
jgi:hypothetical protein